MALVVRTDKKWKPLRCGDEVPARVRESDFDYLGAGAEDSCSFFRYQGSWYHTSMFSRLDNTAELSGWDGILNTSFSTGIVLKLSPDGEEYQVASYRVTS